MAMTSSFIQISIPQDLYKVKKFYRNKDVVFDLQNIHVVAHTKNSLRNKYLGIHKPFTVAKTFLREPRFRVIGKKQTYSERTRYIVMQNNIV